MQLSKCFIGQIVKHNNQPEKIGHIIGLDVNSIGEVILVVQWADNDLCANNPHPIHPSNVSPLSQD